MFNLLGSIAQICARLQFTIKYNPRKLTWVFTFFRGTSATVWSAAAIHKLPFAVRAGVSPPVTTHVRAQAAGWTPPRYDTREVLAPCNR